MCPCLCQGCIQWLIVCLHVHMSVSISAYTQATVPLNVFACLKLAKHICVCAENGPEVRLCTGGEGCQALQAGRVCAE